MTSNNKLLDLLKSRSRIEIALWSIFVIFIPQFFNTSLVLYDRIRSLLLRGTMIANIYQKVCNLTVDWIAISALLFTLFSFWWMNWRKAKVVISLPRQYALNAQNKKTWIELPLIFFNKGAATRVIEDLKLIIHQDKKELILFFNNTTSDLGLIKGKDQPKAGPFAIEGRKAFSNIFAFFNIEDEFEFSSNPCIIEIKALYINQKRWKTMKRFPLLIREEYVASINSNTFLAYLNHHDPHSLE